MARLAALLLLIALAVAAGPPRAPANPLRDSFETPDVGWTSAGGPGAFRVERLEKTSKGVHSGLSCVGAKVVARNDAPVYLAYALDPAGVIDELTIRLWVKSNRPGLQLFARVVLPRSPAPDGKPLVTLLPGTVYNQVGQWQELSLTEIPAALPKHVRWLRNTGGSDVDLREAYIDRVVVNASGGRGETLAFFDDLTIGGLVETTPAAAPPPAFQTVSSGGRPGAAPPTARAPVVRMSGPNLQVSGAPYFPRAIDYNGESLEYLRKLGFNTIRLKNPPTPDISAEAARLGLWIICPPPAATGPVVVDDPVNAPPVLSGEYDPVLAWDMGSDLTAVEAERIKTQAESIRLRDRELARPVICSPTTELRSYSRHCDAIVLSRSPLATSLELPAYLAWLRERPKLARPGTPVWATVQTEVAPETQEQAFRLTAGRVRELTVDSEQIRLVAYTALAGGARGLLFESRSRLDENGPTSRLRARTLELLNLELGMVEPWLATGNFSMTVPGSDPETLAALFESTYSRVLLALWSGHGAQFVPGQLASTNISFKAPGVPESTNAYEITAGSLPTPRIRRVAGGTLVTLDEFGLTAMVLLTSDALAIQHVSNKLGAMSQRAARLERDLMTDRIRLVTEVDGRLRAASQTVPRAQEWIALAQSYAAECDRALSVRDYQNAYLAAQRAVRPLRLLERAHWELATKNALSLVATPLVGNFAALPEHLAFSNSAARTMFTQTDLVGGDFEQLDVLGQAGWRHVRYAEEEWVKTGAELSTTMPHYGRYCLRLWAQPVDPQQAPAALEAAPVWITSPEIRVVAGELLKIQGFVRTASPITASIDGVMIIDSITGQALCERIDKSEQWKQFTLYRVANHTGAMTVTIALTGLGEAFIDDVAIERVARPRDLPRAQTQAMLSR